MYEYAVVEFLNPWKGNVAVVHKSWIETEDKILYCYWPGSAKAIYKAKHKQKPDKDRWRRIEIRIFIYAEEFEKAQKLSRLAEDTSHLESMDDHDDTGPRKRQRSKRLYDSSESGDGDDEDEDKEKKLTPQAPQFQMVMFDAEDTIMKTPKKRRGSAPQEHVEFLPASPTSIVPELSANLSGVGEAANSPDCHGVQRSLDFSHLDESLLRRAQGTYAAQNMEKGNRFPEKKSQVVEKPTPVNAKCGSRKIHSSGATLHLPQKDTSERQCQQNSFQLSVIMKLDKLIEKQTEMQSVLTKILSTTGTKISQEDLDDLLVKQIDTQEELEELCQKLGDSAFKRKLILHLAALGGSTCPEMVRKMLRKIGTNRLWSSYSLRGKKKKNSFADLPLCRVIIKACQKNDQNLKESLIEDEIASTLKFAPHRPGGTNHKKSAKKNPFYQPGSNNLIDEDSTENE